MSLINAEGGVAPSDGNTYVQNIFFSGSTGGPTHAFGHSGWLKSANITSITIVNDNGVYIGAGSKFMVFKLSNV